MASLRVRKRKGGAYYFVVTRIRGRWREVAVGRDRAAADVIFAKARYEEAIARAEAAFGEPFDEATEGQIYFVQAVTGGPIKIGFTGGSAKMRLLGIQNMSPVPLKTIATMRGTRKDEADLHARFASLRLHGEWFADAPELLALIVRIRAARSRDGKRAAAKDEAYKGATPAAAAALS